MLVLGVSCKDRKQPKFAVLGVEPVSEVTLSTAPSSAVVDWLRKGDGQVRTLVHFGSSGLAYLSPDKARDLKALLKQKKWGEIEQRRDIGDQGLFTSENYINAAAQAGLVDEVYWIIPFKYAQYFNAEGTIKKMLEDSESTFLKKDIGAMRFSRGCVSGRLFGIKTHICSPETFPAVPGAVMADMGAEFLAAYAAERRQAPLRGFKEFFDEIKKRRMAVKGVHVSFARDDMSALAMRRYLAAQMADALKDPKLLESPTPPELWSARNDADGLFSEERFAELIAFVEGQLKKFPGDPALLAYEGVSLALIDRTDAALEKLGRLCRKDAHECNPLLFAAAALEESERPAAAEKLILKAMDARPDWPAALLALGNLHFRQRRYGKALEAYEGYSLRRDSLTLRLRLADCLFFLDRKKEAADQYARAIEFVHEMTGRAEISRNWESLNRGVALFREQGSAGLAEKARRVIERG